MSEPAMTQDNADTKLRGEVRRLVDCAVKGDNPDVVTASILAALSRPQSADAGVGEDELLADANAWYSEEQVNEIMRFAKHSNGCLSRKGAHYGEADCDCGLVEARDTITPVSRDLILSSLRHPSPADATGVGENSKKAAADFLASWPRHGFASYIEPALAEAFKRFLRFSIQRRHPGSERDVK